MGAREFSSDPSGVSWANPGQVLADPVGGFPTVPFAFGSLVKTAAPYMEIKWSRDVTKQSSAKGIVKLLALIDAGIMQDGWNAKIFTGGQPHAGGGCRTWRICHIKLWRKVREFWGADGNNGPEQKGSLAGVGQPADEVRLLSGSICLRAEKVAVISETSYSLDAVSHSSCNCHGVLKCQWKHPAT